MCRIEGCDNGRARQRTVCSAHYMRKQRTGSYGTDFSKPISYFTAHQRVTRNRGQAASHPCVDCGEPGAEWSYSHNGEHEFTGEIRPRRSPTSTRTRRGTAFVAWSGHPDDYEPRCLSCHRSLDHHNRKEAV